MSIHEKTGSPFLYIDFQVNNVRYTFSSKTASRAEAEKIQERAMKAARSETVQGRGLKDCTFDQAAYMYWDGQGQHTRGADNLKSNMRRTVLMVGPTTMCSTIDYNKMLDYRRDLRNGLPDIPALEGGRKPKAGKYQAKTVNRYLGLVFTILNMAEKRLKTRFENKPRPSKNHDQDESILEIVRPRHRYLMAEEEKRLEKTSEPDLMDMWKFDLETGLRESNLCDARWSWIDWDEGKHGAINVDSIKATGSSPLPHRVLLSREAHEILRRRQRQGLHPEFIFTLPTRITYWTTEGEKREKGEHIPVSRTLFYDRMCEAWTNAGITNLIVHDFRRTAARRIYFAADHSLHAAQVFLGHSDLDTTEDYIGLGPHHLGEVIEARSRNNRKVAMRGGASAASDENTSRGAARRPKKSARA
jgi:integrase